MGYVKKEIPNSFSFDRPKTDYSFKSSFISSAKPQTAPKASVTYNVGQEVHHKTFGKGMIISATPVGGDTMLEIAFDEVGTKKIMANYAKLTF
jgi:hypothetical protein